MNLRKLIFTNCDAYKAGREITPKGIMVHSTGANNPELRRYVGPDDGLLGKNQYNNHWNMPNVGASVHAFIGKLKDGTVATYQVLPWNYRAGHCYKGPNGSGNDTHIAFEICEDGLKDPVYFGKVYQEAVELCAFLCKQYDLTEKNIICHCEGHDLGIASNHGDVMHWFPKHGKSMATFRADVKKLLKPASQTKPAEKLYRVQVGAFSKKSNAERKRQAVEAAGFEAILACVDNKLWRVQVGAFREKANAERQLAKLMAAGFSGFVTSLSGKVESAPKKSIEEIAREVILGLWGNGDERKQRLTAAGYDYDAVQDAVNKLLQ